MRTRRTRSTSSAPRKLIIEAEGPQVASTEARLPSHTSQSSKSISSTKDGTKGRGDFMLLMKLIALAVVLFFSFKHSKQAWNMASVDGMRKVAAAAVAIGPTVAMWGGTMICSNNMTSELIERLGKPCGPSVASGLNNNLDNTTSEIDYVAHVAPSILPYSNHFQMADILLYEQSGAIAFHSDFDQTLKSRATDSIDTHAKDLYRAGREIYKFCSATDRIITVMVINLSILEYKLLKKPSLGIFDTIFARTGIDTEKVLIDLVDDIDNQILQLIQVIMDCIQTVERADQSGQAYKSALDSIQKPVGDSITAQQKKQGFFWWKSDTEEIQSLSLRFLRAVLKMTDPGPHFSSGQLRRQQDFKNLLSQILYYNTTDIQDRLQYAKVSLERHRTDLSSWKASIKQRYLRPYVPVESVLAMVRAVKHKLSFRQEKLNHAYTTEYQIEKKRQRDNRLYTLPAGPD